MKRIVHISDLHFGTTDPSMVRELSVEILKESPDVLAISGDLTQRARRSEFSEFAEFVKQFSMPKIVVPGNHDIPLFDVLRRFFSPLKRFRILAEPEEFPTYQSDDLFIIGINTAHSWTVKDGRLTSRVVEGLNERLGKLPEDLPRILVCHHPITTTGRELEDWIGGLERIHYRLDAVLTGHRHLVHSEHVTTPWGSTLLIHAGTAVSKRLRGEVNSYNVITVDRSVGKASVRVEVRQWDQSKQEYLVKEVAST